MTAPIDRLRFGKTIVIVASANNVEYGMPLKMQWMVIHCGSSLTRVASRAKGREVRAKVAIRAQVEGSMHAPKVLAGRTVVHRAIQDKEYT
jgi:hypothetical protein